MKNNSNLFAAKAIVQLCERSLCKPDNTRWVTYRRDRIGRHVGQWTCSYCSHNSAPPPLNSPLPLSTNLNLWSSRCVCVQNKKWWLSQWKKNSKLWRDKMVVKLYIKSECIYEVLITFSYKVFFVYSFFIDFCVILLLWSSNLALAGLGQMIGGGSTVLNFLQVFHLTQKSSTS